MKDKAREYHQLGLNIVLVNSDKKPLGKWQKWITQQQTPEEFEALPWTQAKGYGVVCGRLSEKGYYFGAIDIDVKNVTEEAKKKGDQLRKTLRTTHVERTPSNGFHYIYYSKKPIMTNGKAHDFCGCELLGKKKLCIMAPSFEAEYRRLNDNYPIVVESLEETFSKALQQIGYYTKKQKKKLNTPPTKKGKRSKIRPCILEVQKRPHMEHDERWIVGSEYLGNGYTIDETMKVFEGQDDYGDGSKTRQYLEWLKNSGYKPLMCSTIEAYDLCIPSCPRKKVRDSLDMEPVEPWSGDPDNLMREADRHDILEAYGSTIKKDETQTIITFLATLLNYTKDEQQNIVFKSETASGKTHLAVNITKLFPKEDVHYFYNVSPKAFIHEYGTWDPETFSKIVDLERQIMVFLDQKKGGLLSEMRAVLSHDRKVLETKIADRSKKHGLATKTVKIIGYPTWVFCSATAFLGDEDLNRAFLLSAATDKEKLKETLLLLAQKKGNPIDYEKKLKEDEKRKWLRERIKAIKNANIQHIIIPQDLVQQLYDNFIEQHAALTPRHQRDFPRLLALVKAWALFNFANRKRKQTPEGTCVIANENDVLHAQQCYDKIAECNELGVTPEAYQLWREVILPNIGEVVKEIEEPLEGPVEKLKIKGMSRRDIQQKYFQTHHRSLTKKRLENTLNELMGCGLLHEDKGEDKRVIVYKPTFDIKPGDLK